MDVILDANIILADPAFASTQFHELFVYLKRTNSRMVIPLIVLDEVKARFPELLLKYINKARDAWGHVRNLTENAYSDLPNVDVEAAVRALESRIRKPGPGVPDTLFLELPSVGLNDVLQRGIQRKRPASQNGEELRDVVIWFTVKQLPKTQNRRSPSSVTMADLGFRGRRLSCIPT